MKCLNCGWEGEPRKEQVIRWNGVKTEDFCPNCGCNLTLQHRMANEIKAIKDRVKHERCCVSKV